MGNIKLGLQISPTNSSSYHPLLTINGGDWERSCGDMRTSINAIGIYDQPFIRVTFQGKAGYTIAVVMPFGSNDNTTAFIHVPAKAKITGSELSHFVEEVKKVICSNAANPDMSKLKALFSKEYDEKEVASPAIAGIKSKEDGPIAYRMYGTGTGYTLSELLDRLSQTYYANYRAVFFIDKSSGIEVGKGKGEDLSKKETPFRIIIHVREEQDGFTSERHGSIELTEGKSFSTTYRKRGYKDISKTYMPKHDDDEKEPSDLKIDDNEKYIEVKQSDITVYDSETKKQLISASITIDPASNTIEYVRGTKFKNGVSYIKEKAFLHGGITIRAKAGGYKEGSKPISKKEDLLPLRLRFDLEPDWQQTKYPFPEIEIKEHRIKGILLLYYTFDETIQVKDILLKLLDTLQYDTHDRTEQPKDELNTPVYRSSYDTHDRTKQSKDELNTSVKKKNNKTYTDPNRLKGPEGEPYNKRACLILYIIIVIFLAVLALMINLHPTN